MPRSSSHLTAAFIAGTAALISASAGCAHHAPEQIGPRSVTLHFIDSPYADYLFYLLYRDTTRLPEVRTVRLDSVPTLDQLIALPEIVASNNVAKYDDIYRYVALYDHHPAGRVVRSPMPRVLAYSETLPAYDTLRMIVERGAASYPQFLVLWNEKVEPVEQQNIAAWREQAASCHPMDSLQVITHLRFPSSSLDVAAIYFHLAGSNNYSPMGVFSRTFDRPNLAFTLGHEATHLLVNPVNGTNWRTFPAAGRAIALARDAGMTADDLEEMLPLLMQVKLPQACGLTPSTRRISDAFARDTVRHRILRTLEDSWSEYRTGARWPTVIDYFLDRATFALSPHPSS